jgi:hypothetical protein
MKFRNSLLPLKSTAVSKQQYEAGFNATSSKGKKKSASEDKVRDNIFIVYLARLF